MSRLVYIFFFSGVSALLELCLRSWGILFPFCAFFVFYAATALGTNYGWASAAFCAMALDFSSGAEHPWSIFTLGAVIVLAGQWLNKVESDSIMLNFLPGTAIPFITFCGSVIFFSSRRLSAAAELFPGVLPSAVAGAVFLPVLIYVLDTFNHKVGMPLYTDARIRRKHL